jgi:hypothetical protein
MLLEVCCKCGFVHKDGRLDPVYRAYKPHYHWTPEKGKLVKDGVTLHATICVACCSIGPFWQEFFSQKKLTPEQYRVPYSLNAPLPDKYLESANRLYEDQTKYFEFE